MIPDDDAALIPQRNGAVTIAGRRKAVDAHHRSSTNGYVVPDGHMFLDDSTGTDHAVFPDLHVVGSHIRRGSDVCALPDPVGTRDWGAAWARKLYRL